MNDTATTAAAPAFVGVCAECITRLGVHDPTMAATLAVVLGFWLPRAVMAGLAAWRKYRSNPEPAKEG